MRITADELQDILTRLPDADTCGLPVVTMAVRQRVSDVPWPLPDVPVLTTLRVVRFTKVQRAHGARRWFEWELEIGP